MTKNPNSARRGAGLERSDFLMRLPEVMAATTLCKASIYRLRQRGQFPDPVDLIGRTVAWRRKDVERWLKTRPVRRFGQA